MIRISRWRDARGDAGSGGHRTGYSSTSAYLTQTREERAIGQQTQWDHRPSAEAALVCLVAGRWDRERSLRGSTAAADRRGTGTHATQSHHRNHTHIVDVLLCLFRTDLVVCLCACVVSSQSLSLGAGGGWALLPTRAARNPVSAEADPVWRRHQRKQLVDDQKRREQRKQSSSRAETTATTTTTTRHDTTRHDRHHPSSPSQCRRTRRHACAFTARIRWLVEVAARCGVRVDPFHRAAGLLAPPHRT